MLINKKIVKNNLYLNSSYFCIFTNFKKINFLFNVIYNFYYKYSNVCIFFLEQTIFQIIKILYLSLDVIRSKGFFLLCLGTRIRTQNNKKYFNNNTRLCVLTNWFNGTFTNRYISWWTYFKRNLEFFLEKPCLTFFFSIEKKSCSLVSELNKKNIGVVAPIFKLENKQVSNLIDYPLYLNNNSIYSIYFFCCILVKILWSKF